MYRGILIGFIIITLCSCNNEKINFKSGRKIIYYEDEKKINQIIDFNEYAEQDGYYISFDTLGSIQRVQKYLNGAPNGERLLFHSNGNLKTKTTYINGEKQGVEYHYYENGILESELVWRDDTFTQEMREYDSVGKQVFIHSIEFEKYGFSIVNEKNPHGTDTLQTDSKGNVTKDTRKN